jgi:hypothetical protein
VNTSGLRYVRILRRPGTVRLLGPALAARIPDSIAATAIVILVRSVTGSYSAAGLAAGAFGLGTAVSAPLTGRAVDRLGQRRVLPVLAAAFVGGLIVLALGGSHLGGVAAAAVAAVAGLTRPPIEAALRSLYHLKEADPEVWAIPRLTGRAKAGLVAVEYDEYGAGRADRIHAKLLADLMADLGLDNRYGHYLEVSTAQMLAVVNLMSVFGLHRSLRGALVGHYATVEVTSSPSCRRLADAMQRVGAGPAAVRFYTEHVEADAAHEQLVRREVIGGLLAEEPELEPDVIFGIDATAWVEDRFGTALLTAWREGRSSLRAPL